MINNETSKYISLFVLLIALIAFVYGVGKAIIIVDKTQLSTEDGIYTSYITTSLEIKKQAEQLTRNCTNTLCQVQSVLDFTSSIPYKTNPFQKNSPQKTIQKNFGDCDDKSNLLISMLHSLNIEAYFVLVPKHIFVIVPLDDSRLSKTKGLWVNGRKYYILESTAKNSSVGFPLKYKLEQVVDIIEPFINEKVQIKSLDYKL